MTMIADRAPVRIGLVGYGYSGRTFHAPLVTAVPGLRLQAIASSDAAKVHADYESMTVWANPRALIDSDQIDVVVVATPNDTHAPLARAAIDAGKHVVIDKPFALDLAEARDLVERAARRDVLLSVFHNRRWDSDFLTVRQGILSGQIGTVSHFESHIDRFRPVVRDRWRERAGSGSGVWFDLGPHLVDQAMQLFGQPDRVIASLAVQRDGAQTDDWAHAILFYGERRVLLHAGMLVAGGTPRFVVHGDKGSMVKRGADPQEHQLLAGMAPGAPGWGEDADPMSVFDAVGDERVVPAQAGDQRRFYAELLTALHGEGPNPVSPDEALAVMVIVEAAVRSSASGCAVAPFSTDATNESGTTR